MKNITIHYYQNILNENIKYQKKILKKKLNIILNKKKKNDLNIFMPYDIKMVFLNKKRLYYLNSFSNDIIEFIKSDFTISISISFNNHISDFIFSET